ncbi:MAG: hypothetical protein JNJ41_17370 [Bacteroidia bacterium]|nr:hypothetical protein [Bacteroidia bacterium]
MKSKLKIACVGNMNNNMFALVRHLRKQGYNAELIHTVEFDHFKPEADTFEKIDQSYIKEFDFFKSDLLYTDKRMVNDYFSEYNFVIACGYSIAYLTFCKVKIDVVLPYGADLYDLPFFEPSALNNEYSNKQRAALAENQKKGIEDANVVIFDYTNDEFEKIIEKFNFKGTRYKLTFPFIFTHEFNSENTAHLRSKGKFTGKMTELRKDFNFIAFNHIRQSWKNHLDIWSYKGNERIFKAFGNFLNSKNANACLIVFEYGPDVEESKLLIKELGIEKNVVWFPISERKEILNMISFADVGIGEVGDHSWFSYGAIFEFLCMRKPVIHFRKDSLYVGKVDSLYPMYSVATEEELFTALNDCYTNKDKAITLATESHNWFIKHAINKPLDILISQMIKKDLIFNSVDRQLTKFSLWLESVLFFIKLKLKLT